MENFTIQSSNTAFDILSSKLYEHPEVSIIRELTANAIDANVANKSNKKVVLHIPTRCEAFLSVRDFGKGMSPEFVKGVYTTYFASTKAGNSDAIGARGLGSKSPFALFNEFKVITTFNNVKYEYRMFKSENGPSYELVSKDDKMKFENGTEIYIEDASKLLSSAYDIKSFVETTAWEDKVSVNSAYGNFLNEAESKLLGRYDDSYVYIGGVRYNTSLKYPRGYVLVAEKDDVTTLPSREGLHFDEKTKEWIAKQYANLLEKEKEMIMNFEIDDEYNQYSDEVIENIKKKLNVYSMVDIKSEKRWPITSKQQKIIIEGSYAIISTKDLKKPQMRNISKEADKYLNGVCGRAIKNFAAQKNVAHVFITHGDNENMIKDYIVKEEKKPENKSKINKRKAFYKKGDFYNLYIYTFTENKGFKNVWNVSDDIYSYKQDDIALLPNVSYCDMEKFAKEILAKSKAKLFVKVKNDWMPCKSIDKFSSKIMKKVENAVKFGKENQKREFDAKILKLYESVASKKDLVFAYTCKEILNRLNFDRITTNNEIIRQLQDEAEEFGRFSGFETLVINDICNIEIINLFPLINSDYTKESIEYFEFICGKNNIASLDDLINKVVVSTKFEKVDDASRSINRYAERYGITA